MEGETLVIRACTQAPYMDRDDTAAILGLPPERVRIIASAVENRPPSCWARSQ